MRSGNSPASHGVAIRSGLGGGSAGTAPTDDEQQLLHVVPAADSTLRSVVVYLPAVSKTLAEEEIVVEGDIEITLFLL